MKFALTGHTQGIGQRLYERLGSEVIGFSKSTGYDINLDKDRQRIFSESAKCDIFINNAHSNFGQVYLLIEWVNQWKHDDAKTIVNVGSRIAEIELPINNFDLMRYQAEKIALKATATSLMARSDIKCKIKYKWFGYVGTEKILKKYPHFTDDDYISLDKACDIILS